MYIIDPTDKITAVTPSSEDDNYLASNVQDDFRTNPWKAESAVESTLTLAVSTGSGGIGLSNMNSSSVTVLVQTAGPVTVHNETYTIDLNNPNLSVNYGTLASACTITLTFSDPGSVAPYCGVVRCSSVHEFNNPIYGLQEGFEDYSIKKPLLHGGIYYRKRNIVRTFNGTVEVTRDPNFRNFMALIKRQGQAPMFWVLDDEDQDWVVFASCKMPTGTHGYPFDSSISFSLIEMI